ncbi:hypothetical protein F5Y07DRAFT_413507 [Xylaria sp. FL0933]|nr:hypothetical protein F5Y07DRAFT_413507 [Xylaria sp. FL0933]
MAVIQNLPGVEVTIYTDGSKAPEYDGVSEADKAFRFSNTAMKYIECKDNDSFSIHIKVDQKYVFKGHFLNFAAVIDGTWAKTERCSEEDVKEMSWEQDISHRVAKNPNGHRRYTTQQFAFSQITKVDTPTNSQHKPDMKKLEQLGTIEVNLYRSLEGDDKMLIPAADQPKNSIVLRELMDDQTHMTKYTHTQPTTRPKYLRRSIITEDKEHIGTFRFKYRSREFLSSEGIINPNKYCWSRFEPISRKEQMRTRRLRITDKQAEAVVEDIFAKLFPDSGSDSDATLDHDYEGETQDSSSVPETPSAGLNIAESSSISNNADTNLLSKIRGGNDVSEIANTENKTKARAWSSTNKTIARAGQLDGKSKNINQSSTEYYPPLIHANQTIKMPTPNTKHMHQAAVDYNKSPNRTIDFNQRVQRLQEHQQEFYSVLNSESTGNNTTPASPGHPRQSISSPNEIQTNAPRNNNRIGWRQHFEAEFQTLRLTNIPQQTSASKPTSKTRTATPIPGSNTEAAVKRGIEKKTMMHEATKRRSSEITEGLVGNPRPLKISKTCDGREVIDLTGLD